MTHKVLIVDDDPSTRFVVAEAMRGIGWDVTQVEDGCEVEEHLRSDRFDLVILDLYMPGMNGFEVLRQLRNQSESAMHHWKTPSTVDVAVLSGAANREALEFAKKIGADACLAKPFDLEDLYRVVRTRRGAH
jgi:two-component system response regulator TctD